MFSVLLHPLFLLSFSLRLVLFSSLFDLMDMTEVVFNITLTGVSRAVMLSTG